MIENFLINSFNFTILLFLLTFITSIVIDVFLGEFPVKIHPVVFFGKLIEYFTNIFIKINNRISGLYLTLSVVISFLIISNILFFILKKFSIIFIIIIFSMMLSTTFSIKFLFESVKKVQKNLENKDLKAARLSISNLVSRNTERLNEEFIVSATIETLTENVTDSIIAPIFYYFFIGIIIILLALNSNYFIQPFFINDINLFLVNNVSLIQNMEVLNVLFIIILIAFIYRIINTLDAMVGYENKKFKKIGYVPAVLDDILNVIPSRMAGYIMIISSYILGMDWKNSHFILKRDSLKCKSPNSGFTMAAAAGALNIQLIKKGNYVIGDYNKKLDTQDIKKAITLSILTIFMFILIPFIIFAVFCIFYGLI